MDILYLLIPMSLVLVALVGAAFAWSVRSGQFDDLEGPAHRILADDDGSPMRRESGRTGEAEGEATDGQAGRDARP